MPAGLPEVALDPEKYEPDEDGHPRAIVGSWVRDKHARLEKYVGISRSVRQKFIGAGKAGATYIDLFAGPGRARIRDTDEVVHGSPLVAWHESINDGAPFTQVHVADAHPLCVAATEARLRKAAAPVVCEMGPATTTVDAIIRKLVPGALHFAFLDPYNLESLPFDLICRLAELERMDILIHVSVNDLQRNLRKYIQKSDSPLDAFAPGWRDKVDVSRADSLIRGKILEHWRGLLQREGMSTTETHELMVGSNQQRLYWLAFAARHRLALEFWEKVRANPQKQLKLL